MAARTPLYKSLYGQVLIATIAGVVFGYVFPSAGASMRPLGDAFIRLIRMIVAPIVFCTVVVGIAGVGDVKAVGKTGVLTIIYFEVVSTIALLIGLVAVNVIRPGVGMNVDAAKLDPAAVAQYMTGGRSLRVGEFLLNMIPTSIVDALGRSDILQVLVSGFFRAPWCRRRRSSRRRAACRMSTRGGRRTSRTGLRQRCRS